MNRADTMLLRFRLNGEARDLDVSAETRLSDLLRDGLGLTATKIACGIGRCGACTVLMNGRAVNSCLIMAWQLQDAEVITPEGVDAIAIAEFVKVGLAEENAFQCGYCAPGFVMALTALFIEQPAATETDIIAALEGNLCRCTGYHSIIRGALNASERLRAADLAAGPGDPHP
ncbi:(2Fe-2S)-binding protein [Rhizobium sp. HT1-10]|uniref:(2Fe-2S)-binding protein n=1 Tax=Rhizobium sp. HT1-10 TaxID=3111638 RepID=UPI003C25C5A2